MGREARGYLERSWCEEEFRSVELGDGRLKSRVIKTAEKLSEQPSQPINQACESWADTKAAYRLFQNQKFAAAEIIKTHAERTKRRGECFDVLIAATDKSYLSFESHPRTTGLGLIGSNQKQHSQGLIMHTTLAVTPSGLPVGILDQKIWARKKAPLRRKKMRRAIGIEEKESHGWLEGLERTTKLMAGSKTKLVTVADREADIYEFIAHANELGAAFVVRAAWDRALGGKEDDVGQLWAHMSQQKCVGTIEVEVPARGTQQPARTAKVGVYFSQVQLRRPNKQRFGAHGAVAELTSVHVVWVKELDPPKKATALEWMLLTNVAVDDFESAHERVCWYKLRWTIEVFHKILKSGCQVEACRLQSADRLKRYIALLSVIAWRLHWMTHVHRNEPKEPCSAILAQHEWQALYCKIHKTDQPAQKPPTTDEAIRWIARLGGFLDRKGDGEPGIITVWRGWQRLTDIADDYLLFKGRSTCG